MAVRSNVINISILAIFMVISYFVVRSNWNTTPEPLPSKLVIRDFDKKFEAYSASLLAHVSPDRLDGVVKANADYHSKLPFPHTSYDGLFPADVLAAISLEVPDAPRIKSEGCAVGSQKCYNTAVQKSKNAFDKEEYFGPATLAMFKTLKSDMFTKFLEKLTGIEGLIPDPEYRGSGVHQTLSGGQLNIHADFNRYAKYNMHRRVNVFVFLNENWNASYGGQLELWSKDLKSCGAKLSPDMGRFVVFSSSDFSYHGHPHPLACPPTRSRRSLALYYYTKSRPAEECIKNDCLAAHSTLFQTTDCPTCDDKVCKKY